MNESPSALMLSEASSQMPSAFVAQGVSWYAAEEFLDSGVKPFSEAALLEALKAAIRVG